MDIWSTFGREAQSKKSNEVCVFFLGDKSAGKSTLISRFIEAPSDRSIKATVGLEYQYVRKGAVLAI